MPVVNPSLMNKLLSYAALPAAGAAAGGLTGGIFSDEGATGRGALQGALLGAGAGVGGKLSLEMLQHINPGTLALLGTLLGGGVGGLVAQRRVSPWSVEKMKLQELEKIEQRRKLREEDESKTQAGAAGSPVAAGLTKEQSAKEDVMSGIADLVKQAREVLEPAKTAAGANPNYGERVLAFGFGMDASFEDAGLEKSAVAQAAGVTEEQLAESTLAWVNSQLEEK